MSGRLVPATGASVAEAARHLRDGRLVAFPTETVYGLGADASNAEAVRRIFTLKGRPADHPVIGHLANAHAMDVWAREVPAGARALAAAFWPGPLTLVLPRAPRVHDIVTGGQDTVGLRVPSHPVAQALLAAFGGGIAAPSANRFGHVSPTTAAHVSADLGDKPALILDGGACDVGIESTIVAFRGDVALLLRPGGIGIDELTRVLGRAPLLAERDAPRAPGTLASHYAPKTPASLLAPDVLRAELTQLLARDEVVAVLSRTLSPPDDFDGVWIDAARDPAGYAHDLYAHLRALDATDADMLLIEDVPHDAEWLAVRDRLTRATHGEDDDRD
jgi:L-threonylcarbamoyladenylate synthase